MGTNYYLRQPACPACGHARGNLHIGKSSAGWNFGLRIYPVGGDRLEGFGVTVIRELDDWKPLFEEFEIYDEYNEKVDAADMLSNITARSHPNGLLSRLLAGREHMGPYEYRPGEISAGKGTYDLCNFEFS